MPDAFISYSAKDHDLAHWLRAQLAALNVSTFLADASLTPGQDWKPEILHNLREADVVLFLGTPNSCFSDAVKHEIGGALALQKSFVPVMAGIRPHQLPAWVQDKQAVDITDHARTRQTFEHIAEMVTSKRFIATVLIGAFAICAVCFALRSSK